MNNERFFNHYVEILNSTLHEAVGKNIVFQAQAKIAGEDIENLKTGMDELKNKLEEYQNLEKNIEKQSEELCKKNLEIQQLTNERDSIRNEASHIETFRNELISARNEITKLNSEKQLMLQEVSNIELMKRSINESAEKIKEYQSEIQKLVGQVEYLKLSPAKRKKYDLEHITESIVISNEDGGSF